MYVFGNQLFQLRDWQQKSFVTLHRFFPLMSFFSLYSVCLCLDFILDTDEPWYWVKQTNQKITLHYTNIYWHVKSAFVLHANTHTLVFLPNQLIHMIIQHMISQMYKALYWSHQIFSQSAHCDKVCVLCWVRISSAAHRTVD